MDDLLSVFLVIIQHDRPHLPVTLRIITAGIQRNTIGIHPGQIVSHLRLRDLRIKNAKIQQFVPDQVVFETPAALPVKGQAVMVAVKSFFFPGFCQRKSCFPIRIRFFRFSQSS